MTGVPPTPEKEEALHRGLVEREMASRGARHRWWLRRRVGVVAAIVLVLVLLGCREEGKDCCALCGSYRDVAGLEFGVGEALLHVRWKEEVRRSRALADLFPPDHSHQWRLSYHFNWREGWVCGGLYRNRFAAAYEDSEDLRRLVQGKISSGETTREEVARRIGLPRLHAVETPRTVPAGTHDLVRSANAWMLEARVGQGPLWPPEDDYYRWPPEEGGDPVKR